MISVVGDGVLISWYNALVVPEILKSNVSFILGLIGSLWAAIDVCLTIFRSRVRIGIKIVAYHPSGDCLFVFVSITNRSHLAVSVSEISAKIDGEDVPCSLYPYVVCYRKLPGNLGRGQSEPVRSLAFPLNLTPLGGVAGYLYFRTSRPIAQPLSKRLSLSTHTNRRGRVKVECPLQWDDLLHTRYFQ